MSYDISVYPIALREKTDSEGMDFHAALDFMEKKENLIPFSEEQVNMIERHLKNRGYTLSEEQADRKKYEHSKYPSAYASLYSNGLFFNARGEDGIMEISMTAGEFSYYFSLEGHFCVMDTSNGGWQK